MNKLSWDNYYMSLVYLSAMKSKDPSSHLGSVIVGPNKEIRSMGYNGLPRGVNDNKTQRNWRPEKYSWYEHAERNAIYNANLVGIPTVGCIMYTNGTPCADCGRAIIQSGIKEVVVDEKWDKLNTSKWKESAIITETMFKEADVILRSINYKPISIEKFRSGKIIK
jgi:dCMP deaminase